MYSQAYTMDEGRARVNEVFSVFSLLLTRFDLPLFLDSVFLGGGGGGGIC